MGVYVHNYNVYAYSEAEEPGEDKEYINVTLKDFERVDTLGMGGFGRVELVRC
jgi:hypothetical protein